MANATIIIHGNIGGEPRLFQTPTGKVKAVFALASTVIAHDPEGHTTKSTTWTPLVLWGTSKVDRALATLHKGTKALFTGQMASRTWIDKDGNTRTTEELVVKEFHLLAPRQAAQ
jgi:single-strand DNA-binding protein